MPRKILSAFVIFSFLITSLGPLPRAHAALLSGLPNPGSMVNLTPRYQPVIIKGLTIHKDNPFIFDFIVDVGQDNLSGEPLKKEGEKLIKYFLASMAIPDKDMWVNLSPYEKARMIPEVLGKTDMGRDLLEQDYVLKQMTASLIYPEKKLGKTFWDTVYSKAQEKFGTTQIPVNTFNKVWIMADQAQVFEHGQSAFVVNQHLKVMLEEDYLALHKNTTNHVHSIASQVVRSIILPELEKEVNRGKNFANLRQIFNSIILSSWYKRNLKAALLNEVYANKGKVSGITADQATQAREEIYQQYIKAYKKGVFNYIKEDVSTGTVIARKYFSGGLAILNTPAAEPDTTTNARDLASSLTANAMVSLSTNFLTSQRSVATMTVKQVIGSGSVLKAIHWRSRKQLYANDKLVRVGLAKLFKDHPNQAFDFSAKQLERFGVKKYFFIDGKIANIPVLDAHGLEHVDLNYLLKPDQDLDEYVTARNQFFADKGVPKGVMVGADLDGNTPSEMQETWWHYQDQFYHLVLFRDGSTLLFFVPALSHLAGKRENGAMKVGKNEAMLSIDDTIDHVIRSIWPGENVDEQRAAFHRRMLRSVKVEQFKTNLEAISVLDLEKVLLLEDHLKKALILDEAGVLSANIFNDKKTEKLSVVLNEGGGKVTPLLIQKAFMDTLNVPEFLNYMFPDQPEYQKYLLKVFREQTADNAVFDVFKNKIPALDPQAQGEEPPASPPDVNLANVPDTMMIKKEPLPAESKAGASVELEVAPAVEAVVGEPGAEVSETKYKMLYTRAVNTWRLEAGINTDDTFRAFLKGEITLGEASKIIQFGSGKDLKRSDILLTVFRFSFWYYANHPNMKFRPGLLHPNIEDALYHYLEHPKEYLVTARTRIGNLTFVDNKDQVVNEIIRRIDATYEKLIDEKAVLHQAPAEKKVVVLKHEATHAFNDQLSVIVSKAVDPNDKRAMVDTEIIIVNQGGRSSTHTIRAAIEDPETTIAYILKNAGNLQEAPNPFVKLTEVVTNFNKAMKGRIIQHESVSPVGGIDLNTSNGMQWKISKDGRGVEMNVDPAMIARIRREGINWLTPVIFKMTRINNIWSLIGIPAPVVQ